jgi:hypothetical protein
MLFACAITTVSLFAQQTQAQTLPELMYFRFNTVTAGVTPNDAPSGTRVCAGGTLNGTQTIGGAGQFGAAAVGVAGASSANNINTGWATNLPGDWTISLWLNVPTSTATRYYFGDLNTSSLRCFSGGAAGTGLRLTGPFTINTTIPLTPGPTVVHFVHNDAANTVSAYVNGVFDLSVSTTAGNLSGAGPFYVTAYSATNNCLDGSMDEFRMYNRALSPTEIASTWNVDLFAAQCAVVTNLNVTGITSNSADIAWDPVAGSTGYEYVVDQTATDPAGAGTPISGTNTTVTGLLSSTTYYVHVRNICNPAASSAWVTRSFTTLVNPCAYPTNITYNAPTASSATFAWSPVAGSGGYEYAVTSTSTHPTSGIIPTNATSGSATGLTGGATYYLHVRNRCLPAGMSDWATISFVIPECHTPDNILFSHITDNSVNVQWAMMPAANSYEYVVDNMCDDPAIASGATSTSSNTAQIVGLTANTKYYIHIRSLCFINDVSGWAVDSFITHFSCAAPIVTVQNIGTSTPTASWSRVAEALGYEYLMSSSVVPPPFGTETLNTSHSFALPNDGKNYYVHVRVKCFSQFTFSTWSTATLRDMGTGVEEIVNDAAMITAYPNPVKNVMVVDITNPLADATIAILDATGKVLQYSSAAGRRFEFDMSGFAQGVYLLRYAAGEQSRTIRFSKF